MVSVFSEFKETLESKVWPSSNPNDSPFNKFECKHCGVTLELQIFGSRCIGEPSFNDLVRESLRAHLLEHCSDDFLTKHVHVNLLTDGLVFDLLLLREIANQTNID